MTDLDFMFTRQRHERRNALRPGRYVTGFGDGRLYDDVFPLSGKIWVRQITSNGLGLPCLVRGPVTGANVPLRNEVAVIVNYDHDGELAVMSRDPASIVANGQNPLSAASRSQRTFQSQQDFITLLVTPTAVPSTRVHIYGWQPIVNRTVYQMLGQDVDLSGYIPAAGLQRYATLFVKSNYETIEVQISTPISSLGPSTLGKADLQQCVTASSNGSQAIWAIHLADAQTTITDTDIIDLGVDLRQFINTSDAGNSGAGGDLLDDAFGIRLLDAYGNNLRGA